MIINQKYSIYEQMAKNEWLQYGLTTLENQKETYKRKPQGKTLGNSFLTKEKKKLLSIDTLSSQTKTALLCMGE